MLKTRITEQYGLKVPFINAGMAFIATAPLVRAVCSAGGMGMLGAAAMPSDVLQAAIRNIKAIDPVSYGVNIIARFSGIEHIEVCVTEKVPVVVFFGMIRRMSGYRVYGRLAVTSGFKWAAWTKQKLLCDAGFKRLLCKAARRAATTAPPRQHSHCSRRSSMQSLPCPSSRLVALPMVGPLLLRWHSAPTRSGWGLASSRASRPMPIRSTRNGSSLLASRILLAI